MRNSSDVTAHEVSGASAMRLSLCSRRAPNEQRRAAQTLPKIGGGFLRFCACNLQRRKHPYCVRAHTCAGFSSYGRQRRRAACS